MPLQKAPRRRRRDKTTTIVLGGNPSVSLAAASLSLRLGHGAALICHRHIIHYRAATSLPLAQGSLLAGAVPHPLHRGGIFEKGKADPVDSPAVPQIEGFEIGRHGFTSFYSYNDTT